MLSQRHVVSLGPVQRQPQLEVHVRINAASLANGQGDITAQLGEERPSLGVGGSLLMLDG